MSIACTDQVEGSCDTLLNFLLFAKNINLNVSLSDDESDFLRIFCKFHLTKT